jgi:hypothetical protein
MGAHAAQLGGLLLLTRVVWRVLELISPSGLLLLTRVVWLVLELS